jgi:hypothetical protein
VRETVRHYFSCSDGIGTDSTKDASRHITPNLCCCIRWDLRVTYCISVCPGHEMATHYFSCPGGTSTDSTKNALGHVTLNSVFKSGGICGSSSALWCVWVQNGDALFFMLGWDRYGFNKQHDGTDYFELVFLHPMGSMGHVVHSIASGARNGDKLFLMLRWDRYGFDKKRDGTRYVKLVFLRPMGSAGHVVHSGTSRDTKR